MIPSCSAPPSPRSGLTTHDSRLPYNALPDVERFALLEEFWYFIRYRKTWWLLPVVVALLVIGVVVVVAEGSALAPFIYPLF